MRFFTNENKDDRDDARDVDVQDRDDNVQSDPVAVPQQRSNSPWSSTPESDDSVRDDHTASDDDTVRDEAVHDENVRDDTVRDDTVRDDTVRDDTVSDETARDDSVSDETARDDSVSDETARDDTVVDDTVRDDVSRDDVVRDDTDDDTDTVHDDAAGIHRRDDENSVDDQAGVNDTSDEDVHEDPTPPDHAVADTTPESTTTTYGPDGVVTTDDATLKDDGGFDDPKAVDPAADPVVPVASDAPEVSEERRDDESDVDTAAVAAVPVAAAATTSDSKPGEVSEPGVTRLFGDDSQSFKDRWRDVQLRFVDSPKEATAEAATLVDEAVDKLTASLKSQKDEFGGESTEDTEKLRVELRGYRDILNRIIDL